VIENSEIGLSSQGTPSRRLRRSRHDRKKSTAGSTVKENDISVVQSKQVSPMKKDSPIKSVHDSPLREQ